MAILPKDLNSGAALRGGPFSLRRHPAVGLALRLAWGKLLQDSEVSRVREGDEGCFLQ